MGMVFYPSMDRFAVRSDYLNLITQAILYIAYLAHMTNNFDPIIAVA